jgi:hypothetical protein
VSDVARLQTENGELRNLVVQQALELARYKALIDAARENAQAQAAARAQQESGSLLMEGLQRSVKPVEKVPKAKNPPITRKQAAAIVGQPVD